MSPSTDTAARLLDQLAELGMALAERLHEKAMVAEDTKEIIALSEAFCDAGRGLRQCIALKMRIESGSFLAVRAPSKDVEPDDEPIEREERAERPERGDWYERPDWDTPIRLTGDPAQDEALIETAVATAVTRIRKTYARAEAVLTPGPPAPPSHRAMLMAGAAAPRVTDSS